MKFKYKGNSFTGITCDSRKIKRGDLFVACKGEKTDGHDYIEQALRKGAAGFLVKRSIWKRRKHNAKNRNIYITSDPRRELSALASMIHKKPSLCMKTVGITGTNGKTTAAFLLEHILSEQGYKTGLIGTVLYKIGSKKKPASRTTPGALELNKMLNGMVKVKTDFAVMEISSHALKQKRTADIFYDTVIFTNLTPEHLDYHKNIKNYFETKAGIFDNLKPGGIAIINNDDDTARHIKKRVKNRIITFGINKKADIKAGHIEVSPRGSTCEITMPSGNTRISTPMIGRHNIYNILAAVSFCYAGGMDVNKIKKYLSGYPGPPGRLERVSSKAGKQIFIDYAHTPDALKNVLQALRMITSKKIITVFGCGGDRDRAKRQQMGSIAGMLSGHTIVCNDNPRSEDPEKIAFSIEKGLKKVSASYEIILDRACAIKKAIAMCQKNCMVLIAGKGHEKEQIIGKKKIKFDDYSTAKRFADRT